MAALFGNGARQGPVRTGVWPVGTTVL